jgi:peptide/nickel transport system substrate-binding protein
LVLQDGKVDYAYNLEQLPPSVLAELDTGEQGHLVANFGSAVDRIILNRTDPNRPTVDGERSSRQFSHPFFSDKKVRQAFAHAIDREAIAALYGPAGRSTYNNLVAPPQYEYDSLPKVFYDFDLDEAAALLDEAGWVDTDGDRIRDKDEIKLKVVFQTTVGETLQQTQQIVKEALGSIGVEVELKIVDPSIMFGSPLTNPDSVRRFNADMQKLWIMSASPDPSAYMQFWTCDRIPQKANDWSAGPNTERWCNSEYDALYQQAITELDHEKRRQLFIQMNDMLIEDVVMIPVVYLATVQGVSRTIEGVDLTPWDASTWNIKDWRRISL